MIYKLLIAYDGTNYHGWQIQPNGISIQEVIEKAISTMLQEQIRVIGAGRTDAKVHALGQSAHFYTEKSLDLIRSLHSLNCLLPKEIRILLIKPASPCFHAQHSALSKVYRYHLCLDKVLSPFKRNGAWHLHYPIDQQLLFAASRYFLGTHDFTAFANEAHRGVASYDPIRTLYRIDMIQEEGGIALEFEGDGFLYKMVRNIVATIIECASGKRPCEEIPAIFASRDRRKAGPAAPPQGLFLVRINYEISTKD
jgi:tRNA pseudouridine38-40 synthase